MPRSFFARVTRYRPSAVIDPGENRLTEAFAALLEHVPDLATAVAAQLTGVTPTDARVAVRTQRATQSHRFLDLELRFGNPLDPELLIWIEVKHGAELHGDQLDVYAHDIKLALGAEKHLVLLAPRATMPDVDDSLGARKIEWQAVARTIRAWGKGAQRDPVGGWLVEQFIAYLKEEGLADEETLTPAHVFSFAARRAADRAIGLVIEVADVHVRAKWGDRTACSMKGNSPNYGPDWYANHATAPAGAAGAESWRSSHFEWTFRKDRSNPDSRDGYVFCAGATFTSAKDNAAAIADNHPWLAAHIENGFAYTQDWYWRLWTFCYPEELLVERSIDEQGRRLGEWVVQSFRTLADSPPPS